MHLSELRKNVQKHTIEQSNAMLERSAKKLKSLEVGSSVKVYVPEVDRGPIDHCNTLGVVMEKRGTKYGILKNVYSRN